LYFNENQLLRPLPTELNEVFFGLEVQ